MLVLCVCVLSLPIFALSFLFLESTVIDIHNTTQTPESLSRLFSDFPFSCPFKNESPFFFLLHIVFHLLKRKGGTLSIFSSAIHPQQSNELWPRCVCAYAYPTPLLRKHHTTLRVWNTVLIEVEVNGCFAVAPAPGGC